MRGSTLTDMHLRGRLALQSQACATACRLGETGVDKPGHSREPCQGDYWMGDLYPVCPETNDECWSKNRLVRFVYSPY